jgi:hypothetical protein
MMMMVIRSISRNMTVITAVFIPPTFTAFRHGLFSCCRSAAVFYYG